MKLSRLAVKELRQFATPFELLEFEPGLNLISGANETGKSALVRALQAVFFERYSTKSVDDLRPWQDGNAAPEVQVEFEHDGHQYQLLKRFLKKSQCRLRVGSEHYQGDQAEALLQQLLGFSYPGKGASKEEYWGIPGLLWITQGTGQELARPIAHAHDFLRETLSQGLEEIATSGGDALINEVAADRALLLTQTGKPTGDLKALAADAAEAKQALADIDQKIAQYQQTVDRLGSVQAEWRENDSARPWEKAERKKKDALDQLENVNRQRQSLARDQAALKQAQSERQLLFEQLRQWEQDARKLDARAIQVKELEARLMEAQKHRAEREARVANADQHVRESESVLAQAENAQKRGDLEARIAELRDSVERDRKRLLRARNEQEKRLVLQQALAQTRISTSEVEALAKAEETLRVLESKREAVATRVRYQLNTGQTLTLGEQRLSGEGEVSLIELTALELPGVGHLTIEPGGHDLARLALEKRDAQQAFDRKLADLRVSSLALARRRLADQRESEQQLDWLDRTLKDLAPEGIQTLAVELETREAAVARQQDALESLPPAPESLVSVTSGLDDRARARQHHQEALAQERTARELEVAARTELRSAVAEYEELIERIQDPARQEKYQASENRLLELGVSIDRLGQHIAREQAAIDVANPQLLEDDVQRFGRTAEATRAAQRDRETEMARLEGALSAEGAASLGEKRAELQARCERLERHHHALELRANALDILFQRLQRKRAAMVERLQAPLQKHVAGYLRILFPEAELKISEAFQPGRLLRNGATDIEFDCLSFGAREQVGVILRLAYADALKEAGRPTLIVLDDALVHSDRERREAMQRVLYSAARRHQILLFTCHPDNWTDLGVPVRALEKLKAEAGL